MPYFNVKSPGNVNAFNGFFTEIASFQIVSTDFVDSMLFYFPEMDPISLNLLNAGFMNNLMIPALGTLLYFMMV